MKRFFCTTCKKVKRVRKHPTRTINRFSEKPEDRLGTCNRHVGRHG